RRPSEDARRWPEDGRAEEGAPRAPGSRMARRRGGEDARRERVHAVIAGVVGHLHRPESPQQGDLLRIEPRGTVQPRNEDHGQRFSHHTPRSKPKKLSHNSTYCTAAGLTFRRGSLVSAQTVRPCPSTVRLRATLVVVPSSGAARLRTVPTRGFMSFSQLGLSEKVLAAVQAAGYTTPTPIQQQAIPHV